jgi:hypothetical protein
MIDECQRNAYISVTPDILNMHESDKDAKDTKAIRTRKTRSSLITPKRGSSWSLVPRRSDGGFVP